MPSNTLRLSAHGRPPRLLWRKGGNNGSILAHCLSLSNLDRIAIGFFHLRLSIYYTFSNLATPKFRVLKPPLDHLDLFELSMHWQGSGETSQKADLNYDGIVDAADLLLLIELMK